MKKFWKKTKTAVKECLNLITNLFCPIVSAVCVLAEALHLPTSLIQSLKKAEYWFWQVGGTKDDIDNFIEEVDKAIDKTEQSK